MRKSHSRHGVTQQQRRNSTYLGKKKEKEKKLPLLKLKYFDRDVPGTPSPYTGVSCHWCKKTDIFIGGGLDLHTRDPKVICEDCAIDRYRKDHGFSSREAAALRRRRIFDVAYLFQEHVIDMYLTRAGVRFEDIDTRIHAMLLELGQTLYNESFSKREKVYLEERVNQDVIERRITLRIREVGVDLNELPQVSPYEWL